MTEHALRRGGRRGTSSTTQNQLMGTMNGPLRTPAIGAKDLIQIQNDKSRNIFYFILMLIAQSHRKHQASSRCTTLQSEVLQSHSGKALLNHTETISSQTRLIHHLKGKVSSLETFIREQAAITQELYKDKCHLADQVMSLKAGRTIPEVKRQHSSSEYLQKTKSSYRIATQQYQSVLQENSLMAARLKQLEQNDLNYQRLVNQKVAEFQAKERTLRERITKLESHLKEKVNDEFRHSVVEEYAAKLATAQEHIARQAALITSMKARSEEQSKVESGLHATIALLQAEIERVRSEPNDGMWEKWQDLQTKVGRNQTELHLARELNEGLEEELVRLDEQTKSLQQNVHDVSGDFSQAIIDRLLEMSGQVFDLSVYLAKQ